MKRALLVCFLAVLYSLPAYASDQSPANLSNPEQYSRSGFMSYAHDHAITTSATLVSTSTGTSTPPTGGDLPKLWKFGAQFVASCDVRTVACWVSDTGATVTVDGYIIDAGSTGAVTEGTRGCFDILSGTYRDQVPQKRFAQPADSSSIVSVRSAACDGSSSGFPRTKGFPCDAAADCFYDGATCEADNTPEGLYLLVISQDGASTGTCFFGTDQ